MRVLKILNKILKPYYRWRYYKILKSRLEDNEGVLTEEMFDAIVADIVKWVEKPQYVYFPSEEAKEAYLEGKRRLDEKYKE